MSGADSELSEDGRAYLPDGCDVFRLGSPELRERETRKREKSPGHDGVVDRVRVARWHADGKGQEWIGSWPPEVVTLEWAAAKFGAGMVSFQGLNKVGQIIVQATETISEEMARNARGALGVNGGPLPAATEAAAGKINLGGFTLAELLGLAKLARELLAPPAPVQTANGAALEGAIARMMEMQAASMGAMQTMIASIAQAQALGRPTEDPGAQRAHDLMLTVIQGMQASQRDLAQAARAPAPVVAAAAPSVLEQIDTMRGVLDLARDIQPKPDEDPPWVRAVGNTVQAVMPPLTALAMSKALGPDEAAKAFAQMGAAAPAGGGIPGFG